MPSLSIYLNQKRMDEVRAKSRALNKSISQVIDNAIEVFMKDDERKKARRAFLSFLKKEKPLTAGKDWKKAWEEVRKEREIDDADRN